MPLTGDPMKYCIAAFLFFALTGCATFNRDQPSVYVVFFQKAGTELSPDAQRIISDAARTIRQTHPDSVIIAAGALAGDNLTEPRVVAVHQALVSNGVDTALIARAGIPDGPANIGGTGDQRVEIRLVRKPAP